MYGGGYNNNYNQGFQAQNAYGNVSRTTPTTFASNNRATPSWQTSQVGMNNNEVSATNWTQGRGDNYTPTPMSNMSNTANMDARSTPSAIAVARTTPPPPRKGQTTSPVQQANGAWSNPDMEMGGGQNYNKQMPAGTNDLDVNSAQKALSIRGRDFYRAASMSIPAGQKPWEMDNAGEMKAQKGMGNDGMGMGMNGGGMNKGMGMGMNNGMGMGMNNGMGMGMNNGMGMGMGMNNGMGMGMNNGMGMGGMNDMGYGMGMNMGMQKPAQSPPYTEHQGPAAQYLRDVVLGLNDGLVSVLLLTLGLAGGNLTTTQILLAGLTASLAGAISMALGEYIATKSQAQVTHAELTLENDHLLHHRAKEIGQVRAFMQELNVKGELLDKVATAICQRDEAMIRLMMTFEFGFTEELERNPLKAMLTSGALFITGSLPAFLPYAMTTNVTTALGITIALSCVGLFSLGAGKCYVTKGVWWYDGLETLALGAMGGSITFGLGQAYKAGTGA